MSTPSRSDGPPRLGMVAAFGAVYLLWGSTYLAILFAIETLPPYLMAAVRFLIAGAMLYIWVRLRGAERPTRTHWVAATIVGGLLLLGGNGSVVLAEQWVPSGSAALVIATVPLWMVLLDWARRGGVRPGLGTVLGILGGFAGVGLLVTPGDLAGGRGLHPLGAGLLVFAALTWAAGSLYSRKARLPSSVLLGTAMQMLCGGGLLLAAGVIAGEPAQLSVAAVSLRSVLALGYLIVFGSLVAFSCYIWILRVSPPALAATYAYVNPLVAVLLGWGLAGEVLNPRVWLATGLIVSSVLVITLHRGKPGAAREQQPPPSPREVTAPPAPEAPAKICADESTD